MAVSTHLSRVVVYCCVSSPVKDIVELPHVQVVTVQTSAHALDAATLHIDSLAAVVIEVQWGSQQDCQECLNVLKFVASRRKDVFQIIVSDEASRSARDRFVLMSRPEVNCHMVSHSVAHVVRMLTNIAKEKCDGKLRCPLCSKQGLHPDELWVHLPQFHISRKNVPCAAAPCPICGQKDRHALLVHVHDSHAPRGECVEQRRESVLDSFALCVIQRRSDKKFLLVQEYCGQGFWLPGGHIEGAEQPVVAATREAAEETGVAVVLTGFLRVEHSSLPQWGRTRLRFIFYGRPSEDDVVPKTYPDFESAGACWVSAEEVLEDGFPLRGGEPVEWVRYITAGGPIFPIQLVAHEGSDVLIPSAVATAM